MIYLDNNATTPVDEEVLQEMQKVARDAFGNPGSRHQAGRKARQVLEESRETIAQLLDAQSDEVVFTSGGTESSNLAIFGLTAGRTGSILLPPGEHPATNEPVKRLVQRGFRKVKLKLSSVGQIQNDSFLNQATDDIVLATSILAHNETGTLVNVQPLISWCEEHGIPIHVDAVQAAGKIPLSFRVSGATTMSIGAHKFHGPRGIGALLIRERVKVFPQLVGGHQERGLRAGTEPVMLAAGMAKALQKSYENLEARHRHLQTLRDALQSGLEESCAQTVVNGDQQARLPNTLNIAFLGCNADALLVALDMVGICCSHGSACASGSSEPAPILLGMNCPPAVYQSSLRFSVGMQNNMEEVHKAVQIISETVTRLRGITK